LELNGKIGIDMRPIDPQKQKLEEEIKKTVQSGTPIDPELMEYAESIFPALRSTPPLPENYNQLAIQEANEDNYIPESKEEEPSQPTRDIDRIRNLAIERLRKKNYVSSSGIPNLNLLEKEVDKIREEESQKAQQESKDLGEKRYEEYLKKQKEREQLKKLGMEDQTQPDLSNKAFEMFPNLAGIVGAPRDNYVESDEVSPQAAQASQEIPVEKSVNKKTKESPKDSSKNISKVSAPKIEEAATQLPQREVASKEPSIEELMKQADEREKKAELDLAIAKFRDAIIGAGGTGFKSDLSQYEAAIKKASKPLTDYQLKKQLEKLKAEENNRKAKDDPNSEISKLIRETLQTMGKINMQGLENVSYSQLEKIYPSITNALINKLSTEARKEEAQANRIYRQTQADYQKIQQADKKKESAYKDLYSKTNKILESDQAKLFRGSIGTQKLIDAALKNWDKSGDDYKVSSSAAFMSYAKTAQQDPSVVRESDMKVLAGGVNYGSVSSLLAKFAAKTEGAQFTPSELQAFKAVMGTIRSIQSKDLQKSLNPILKKASESEVDTDLLVDPEMRESIYSTPKTPEERLKELEEKLSPINKRLEELKKKR